MYTIIVNDDNSLYASHKERIIRGSKLVNDLVFIVDPMYNGIDMTSASVILEYVLPISRDYKTEWLTLSDERYNGCFLQYKLPFDTNLTNEAGSIAIKLTFVYSKMDTSGNITQRVRKTSSTTIEVVSIDMWCDLIPDSALSAIDQRIVKQDAQIRALADLVGTIDNNSVDDLVYDEDNETLQLHANGVGVGRKVSVRDMLDDGTPVVDLDSNNDSNSDSNQSDDCDCGCEDGTAECNVVEF